MSGMGGTGDTGQSLRHSFGIAGKVALVTGATSGIGRMIAETLLRHGVRVYISGRREALCQATAEDLSEIGDCRWIAADLAVAGTVDKLVAELSGSEDALHILVNNAGLTRSGAVDSYPMDLWDETFAVNVRAPFELSTRLLPLLGKAATRDDPARIINISSMSSHTVTNANQAYAYGPSKAALNQLTRALAVELAPRQITVNAIAPGTFASNMTQFDVGGVPLVELAAQVTPLGRVGKTDDAGGLVVFLSGPSSTYLTGAVIPLDGAWSIKGI